MMKPEKLLSLVRNKSKRICLALNPRLWSLLEKAAHDEGMSPTNKLEDLIINYLDRANYLDEAFSEDK